MFQENYNDMISLDDLCEMISIGKNTAYRLLKTNQIKAFKIGQTLIFVLLYAKLLPVIKTRKPRSYKGFADSRRKMNRVFVTFHT